MKTAISLPDEIFERATRRAADLGMSRSEFFSRAARRYLDDLDSPAVTEQINRALDGADEDGSGAAAAAAGRRRLAQTADDDW